MERHVEGLLARDGLAPSSARKLVTQALHAWGAGALVADAVLLVDELVVNVLDHVDHGVIQVDVRFDDRVVRVDVTDPEPDFVQDHRRPRHELPRVGLRIVDTLAARWGVTTSPVGKSVWFELDLAPVEGEPEGGSGGDPPVRWAAPESVDRTGSSGMAVTAGAAGN